MGSERAGKDVVSERARTPAANRINGRRRAQQFLTQTRKPFPLRTSVGTVTIALGTARDRDHRLDRRLSSTRLCPTYPCL